jgi:hypothetical protein
MSLGDYLQGACVWNGVAMQTNPRWVKVFPPAVLDEIDVAVDKLGDTDWTKSIAITSRCQAPGHSSTTYAKNWRTVREPDCRGPFAGFVPLPDTAFRHRAAGDSTDYSSGAQFLYLFAEGTALVSVVGVIDSFNQSMLIASNLRSIREAKRI